jgi:anti-sigma-K factor RskA
MSSGQPGRETRHEIEALLPWYAAGTLSRSDADRVERALAGDNELAQCYDRICEELVETICLNKALGAPSELVSERLFAAIDTEEIRAPRTTASALEPNFSNDVTLTCQSKLATIPPVQAGSP